MNVKTILAAPDNSGFYVSSSRWNDPPFAFRNAPTTLNDWRYIGGPGWYGSEEGRVIYQQLAALVDLHNWWPGEYEECDLTIGGE